MYRQYDEAAKRCDDCLGLDHCSQDVKGCYHRTIERLGEVYLREHRCRHYEAALRQKRLRERFTASRIPAIYLGLTWDDFRVTADNEPAFNAAKATDEELREEAKSRGDKPKPGLFVQGQCGCGKTMLMAIKAQELMRQGKTVLMAAVPDLLEDIRRSYDTGATAQTLEELSTADVLVLDDLGSEQSTEWAQEQLYRVVNRRYGNGDLLTLVTSNIKPGRIANRSVQYERIVSRLWAMCRYVQITGSMDWRIEKP